MSFTWVPFYEEAASCLVAWEQRQPELISFLERLRQDGLPVTRLQDRDASGANVPLREIDPFTFFGAFNRQIRQARRLAIIAEVKELLTIGSEIPSDFAGIPILDNMRSWFFSFASERKASDVPTLWRVFRLALAEAPLDNPAFAESFDAAVALKGVNVNLTMGLFWIRPKTFLNLDSTNRAYLGQELPRGGLTFATYRQIIAQVRTRFSSMVELSQAAWNKSNTPQSAGKPSPGAHGTALTRATVNHWLVGAFWDGSDPSDQTDRFRQEGIWENGYSDKYLDEVRNMAVGDRIAIKSAFVLKANLPFDARGRSVSCMDVKAVGTVVKNRGDGRVVEVEWDDTPPPGRWYFYTNQKTIWRLRPDEEYARRLIDFAFHGVPQDYAWFVQRWESLEDPAASTRLPGQGRDAHPPRPYGLDDLIADGVFVPKDDLARALERLKSKKNLILQGPPGVGKTFVARRLAYALMQEEDPSRVEMVAFHPSYAYEDFVRGFRPAVGQAGSFELRDGIFFSFCRRAEADPDRDYVFIVDEINRGNLAAIFGDLLILIEADKRGQEFSVPLVYRQQDEDRFHVPKNVYLIGMMNLADRSLAMVDYALRRRFAFLTLRPAYGSESFRTWLTDRRMNDDLVSRIVARMAALNRQIADNPQLGEHYQLGHSFFCPRGQDFSGLDEAWFRDIVETEVAPLLEEYWFDDRKRAEAAREALLAP